jgi:hypothetical protein
VRLSKVWEIVQLNEGDAVTIRVPHYHLTLSNERCIAHGHDDVVILLDKLSSKFRFGPVIDCEHPTKAETAEAD